MITILKIEPKYKIERNNRTIDFYVVEFRYEKKNVGTGTTVKLEGTYTFHSDSTSVDLVNIVSALKNDWGL